VSGYRRMVAFHGRTLLEDAAPKPLSMSYRAGAWVLSDVSVSSGVVTAQMSSPSAVFDVSGQQAGALVKISFKARTERNSTLLSNLLLQRSGHGVFVVNDARLVGYIYDGSETVDASRAPAYQELTFVGTV
jgi:hypothetical protein